MNEENPNEDGHEKSKGYQLVTHRLTKKMSVKFQRDSQDTEVDQENQYPITARNSLINHGEKSPRKQLRINPQGVQNMIRQGSSSKLFSTAVNIPPFMKENGFFQRKKTFEAFVKEGDKMLNNRDMTKSAMLEKIQRKTNKIKSLSNVAEKQNEEVVQQEYKKLDQNKSKGTILTNEFWSKSYYDYIIKRSKVKKDLDRFIQKKKMEPTPVLLEKFDHYFMDKFMKNEDDEGIIDKYTKKNSLLISQFLTHQRSNSSENQNNQCKVQPNNPSSSNAQMSSPRKSSMISTNYNSQSISPFQRSSNSTRKIQSILHSNEQKHDGIKKIFEKKKGSQRTISLDLRIPAQLNDPNFRQIKRVSLQSRDASHEKMEKSHQEKKNSDQIDQISQFSNTLENLSFITNRQEESGQKHKLQLQQTNGEQQMSNSKKILNQPPQIQTNNSLYQQLLNEISGKQESQHKNQYATLDFYLKVIKDIDGRRFEKRDKNMIQDQFVKHSLLKASQNIKHQRSQSQSLLKRNEYKFKSESPYSISNLNYNYSSRHTLRSGSQLHLSEEERGSMQSLFSNSVMNRSPKKVTKDPDFPKDILIEGMGKLIQTCEQFHHENMNVMAVIDKAKDIKNKKLLLKKEQKRQEGIITTLNVLLERKEKDKKLIDPRNRLIKNKKSKYYYVED